MNPEALPYLVAYLAAGLVLAALAVVAALRAMEPGPHPHRGHRSSIDMTPARGLRPPASGRSPAKHIRSTPRRTR